MARTETGSLWIAYKAEVVKLDHVSSERSSLTVFEWCDKKIRSHFLYFNFVCD